MREETNRKEEEECWLVRLKRWPRLSHGAVEFLCAVWSRVLAGEGRASLGSWGGGRAQPTIGCREPTRAAALGGAKEQRAADRTK